MNKIGFRPSLHVEHDRGPKGSHGYLWLTLEGKREDTVTVNMTENDLIDLARAALDVAGILRNVRERAEMKAHHRADPYSTPLGVQLCRECDKPVRTASGGQHPVHAA